MFCGVAICAVNNQVTFNSLVTAHSVKIVLAILILGSWYASGTGINDYADYEIDMVNVRSDKDRPLVRGIITKKELQVIILVLIGFTLAVSIYINLLCFLISGCFIVLNAAYSLKPLILSRRGGIAPLLLPLGYIVYPILLASVVTRTRLTTTIVILIVSLYLQFCSRIILKDYRDVVGDAKAHKITFLLKHGSQKVVYASLTALVLSVLITGLVVAQKAYLGYVCIVFLTSAAAYTLYQLPMITVWSKQKPVIVAYGRLMSGATCLLFFSILKVSNSLAMNEFVVLVVLFALLFCWSSFDTLRANIRH